MPFGALTVRLERLLVRRIGDVPSPSAGMNQAWLLLISRAQFALDCNEEYEAGMPKFNGLTSR